MSHTVFICHDYMLVEVLDQIQARLERGGIEVLRGPQTAPGKKLVYSKESYTELFGRAEVMMFSSRSICSREIMLAAPRLRGIVNPTIGLETVDLAAANELGIIVGHGATPENFLGMAEATVMLIHTEGRLGAHAARAHGRPGGPRADRARRGRAAFGIRREPRRLRSLRRAGPGAGGRQDDGPGHAAALKRHRGGARQHHPRIARDAGRARAGADEAVRVSREYLARRGDRRSGALPRIKGETHRGRRARQLRRRASAR